MDLQRNRIKHNTRLPSVAKRKTSPNRKCMTKDLHLPVLSTRRSASPYARTIIPTPVPKPKIKNPSLGHRRLLNIKFITKLAKLSGATSSTADTIVEDLENPIKEPDTPKLADLNSSTKANTPIYRIDPSLQVYLDSDLTSELNRDPKTQFREPIEIKRGRIIKLEYNDLVIEDTHLMPLDSESPKFSRRGNFSSPFDLDEVQENSRWISPVPPRPETRITMSKPPNYLRHFRSNSNVIM
ncbi:unnamed protein product [Blepharisma stoltei]|uniref:Uncharacterized protein n=1 Tax=Blepharisma stoltei TaxID=1481888 RepID=A0AAU9IN17_9CILI|nr:unnamed protein product [Blepharisma stoltei]